MAALVYTTTTLLKMHAVPAVGKGVHSTLGDVCFMYPVDLQHLSTNTESEQIKHLYYSAISSIVIARHNRYS